jgi:hypothetical protein
MDNTGGVSTELNLLIDILKNKTGLLETILVITENQEVIIHQPPGVDRAAIFREMTLEKQKFIDEVLNCDNVFQSIFDGVHERVENERRADGSHLYRDQLVEMQRLIDPIMELDVKVRAQEAKNKQLLEVMMPAAAREPQQASRADKGRILGEYNKYKRE